MYLSTAIIKKESKGVEQQLRKGSRCAYRIFTNSEYLKQPNDPD